MCSCPPSVESLEAKGNIPLERDGDNEEKHQRNNSIEKAHSVMHSRQYCAMCVGEVRDRDREREGGGKER